MFLKFLVCVSLAVNPYPQRYAMKITSKVIGSVNPDTLCRSDGHLLFACGNEVVITGGENGQQLGTVLHNLISFYAKITFFF